MILTLNNIALSLSMIINPIGFLEHKDVQVEVAVEVPVVIQKQEYPVAVHSEVKYYMDYRKITLTSSDQYKLQQQASTNEHGIRTIDNRLCIALGSYFGSNIGDKYDITLSSGKVMECILSDQKADKDTDECTHSYSKNNNIIEFIVDIPKLSKISRKLGEIQEYDGYIVKVEKLL